MDYFDSDSVSSDPEQSAPEQSPEMNNFLFMIRNLHLYPIPPLPREFQPIESQSVPDEQVLPNIPLYVSDYELSDFTLNQVLMYILLSILEMRDMITFFEEVDL